MPYAQLNNGFNIHYQQRGNGGIPIIFIHGNFGSWRHWLPCLDNLPSKYTGYAPDLRGCGDSQVTDNGYDIETLSQDILYFADNLKLDKFHLVGHSLGGAVSQELAGTHPKRIMSLTLVAPAPAEGMASLQMLPTDDKFLSTTNIWHFFNNIGIRKTIHTLSFKKTMPGLRYNRPFLNLVVEDALKMDIKAFDGFLKALKKWQGMHHLNDLNFPVLIIHGELDTVIPLQPLRNMQQTIQDCQLLILKGVGHSPQLENANAFNNTLYSFLNNTLILTNTEEKIAVTHIGLLDRIKNKLKSFFKKIN